MIVSRKKWSHWNQYLCSGRGWDTKEDKRNSIAKTHTSIVTVAVCEKVCLGLIHQQTVKEINSARYREGGSG